LLNQFTTIRELNKDLEAEPRELKIYLVSEDRAHERKGDQTLSLAESLPTNVDRAPKNGLMQSSPSA